VEAGGEGELTLSLADQNHRALDPTLTMTESGLRSGITVAVTRRSQPVADTGPPVAVALILAGPDFGKEFSLWPGTAYIGRGYGAEIRVSDSSVSRRHAKLVVTALPASASQAGHVLEVVDLGSANGISVSGAEVPRAVLQSGDQVRLGDTDIEVRLTAETAALTCQPSGLAESTSVAFTRSPRIAPLFEGCQFGLPDLPERPKPARMPWLAMMLPALMGMGLFALTQSPRR
jgi:S-DNA-T family DNA segregation ATPase FtsK/SpoIIIE